MHNIPTVRHKVNFYGTQSRADRRVSISGIRKQATQGDTIITWADNHTIIVNVSQG